MSRASCLVVAVVVAVAITLAALFSRTALERPMSPLEERTGYPLPANAPPDEIATSVDRLPRSQVDDRASSPLPANATVDEYDISDGYMSANAASDGLGEALNSALDDDSQSPQPDTGSADVEKGMGAFSKLPDMEVDNWYTVEFSVAPDAPSLAEETEDRELTQARAIYVAPIMRVTLLGDPGFEIRPKTTDPVRTGRDRAASWQWSVKPITDGERTLYAKVEVLERLPDGKLDEVDSFTRRVAVQVKVGTWKGFLIAIRNAASLGDALATLFASWEKTLVALGALIAAASAVWLAFRNWGKPPKE